MTQAGPNTSPLKDALERLAQQAKTEVVRYLDIPLVEALQDSSLRSSPEVTLTVHRLGRELVDPMENDESLAPMSTMFFHSGGGRGSIHPQFTATALLTYAIQNGCDAALSWLNSALVLKQGSGIIALAIWGPRVQHAIELTPQITLCPIDDLPESYAKARLNETPMNPSLATAFDYATPSCALVYKHMVEPLFSNHDENWTAIEFQKAREKLYKIAPLLGLVGPQLSIPGVSWFTFDNPALERLKLESTRTNTMLEVLPIHIPDVPPIDPKEASSLVNAYLSLQPAVAERIDVAIDRLSLALRRRDAADKAVELSIALESLLSDMQPNEVTHKVKVRATRLLAGDEATRTFNFGVIGRTYEIRSMLVHTGKRDSKNRNVAGTSMTPIEITEYCARLCADIVVTIMSRKEFPVWSVFDIT